MGTHFKGNKAELIALTSWIKLLRASDSVFKKIRPSMVQYNLSTTQFAVLEVLFHLGSLSQKVIGQKLLRSSGNIVKVIDNLERDKLVSREPDPNDRRAYKVVLTKEGERMVNQQLLVEEVKKIVSREDVKYVIGYKKGTSGE